MLPQSLQRAIVAVQHADCRSWNRSFSRERHDAQLEACSGDFLPGRFWVIGGAMLIFACLLVGAPASCARLLRFQRPKLQLVEHRLLSCAIPKVVTSMRSFVAALAIAPSLLAVCAPFDADAQSAKPGVPAVQRPMTELGPSPVIPIAKTADWVAITSDAVWVAGANPDVVRGINPATNRIVTSVSLPGEPCAGLSTGFGSIWVPLCGDHGRVARVDQRSGRVTAIIDRGPAQEGGIAASGDSIWFTSDDAGTLLRIDPRSNQVRQTIRIAAGSHNPVGTEDLVWITSVAGNLVTAVDASTGAVVGTVPTGPQPRFLAAGGGFIWVLNQGDGSVTRIDAQTRRVIATIAVGIPGHGGDIAYGGGRVWTTIRGIPLSVIDPATNAVDRQWVGAGGDSLRYGHGSVWLTDYDGGTVSRIAPSAGARLSSPLVGTWRLVSYVDTPEGGDPIYAFGKQPVGEFMFTADGRVSINIMRNPPDPRAATTDIDPDACVPTWYCSYFGTYSVAADGSHWTTHVLGGNVPSYLGTDQSRSFRIEGNRMIIAETYQVDGKAVRAERVLER